MAHKKAGGTASNLRDSQPQYLGIKIFGNQAAKAGSIIVRQRGNKFRPGKGVMQGKDHTLFSVIEGFVKFTEKRIQKFSGNYRRTKFVSVEKEKIPMNQPKKEAVK